MGNVEAGADGVISKTLSDNVIQLYGATSVIGRTVVLHALPDDLGTAGNAGSQATGNSGARIACGVIGYEF